MIAVFLMILQLERSQSPWNGFTASWAEEDRGMKISAGPIAKDYERIPRLDAYGPGDALLAIDRKNLRVVANEKFFSDLSRIDATRKFDEHVIGKVKDAALYATPARLAEFVVVSDLIHCYAHVGATVELAKESDGPVYRAEFKGEHEYFTNARHTAPLHFAVEIDKKTGVVTAFGL